MRYSIEPRDMEKDMDFCPLLKNRNKSLSSKYGEKRLHNTKKSTTDAIKTASKRAIQKTAVGTGDLIDNKIADKITNISKKSSREIHSQNNDDND